MFDNILVPTDLSEKSIKALEIAAGIKKNDKSNITLIHVIETIDDDEGDEEFRSFYDKLASRAQKKMEKIIKKYQTNSFEIKSEITYGKRVDEILRFTSENSVDLIILSSHKINDITAGSGWATISYRVGILAQCPVMMVKL